MLVPYIQSSSLMPFLSFGAMLWCSFHMFRAILWCSFHIIRAMLWCFFYIFRVMLWCSLQTFRTMLFNAFCLMPVVVIPSFKRSVRRPCTGNNKVQSWRSGPQINHQSAHLAAAVVAGSQGFYTWHLQTCSNVLQHVHQVHLSEINCNISKTLTTWSFFYCWNHFLTV